MPFTRPTIVQLIDRARADITTRLAGADARLKNSVEDVIARLSSGSVHGLHGHLVWLSRQIMPDTAESEFMSRWADLWGISRGDPVQSTGSLTITGTNTTVCPAGTEWQSNDGTVYTQDANVTISGGSATATITAEEGGEDGDQLVGVKLTIVTPIAGIDSEATVAVGGLTGGDDGETDSSLLNQLLQRLQSPPKGGGPGDYVSWALEVDGVTRAWQYPNLDGIGTVGVYFVMDEKAGTIIPNASEVQTVQTYLDSVAPVTADVNVYAPTAVPLDITCALSPNTATVQAACEAEITAYLLREAEPGVTLKISQIDEAISIAPGEEDHLISIPTGNVPHTAGQLPTDGSYTWSALP
jgi:uncharacterized phage protein gp47/JayE